MASKAWREPHGLEGGEEGPDGDLVRAAVQQNGAVIMGRRMFSGGSGPWEDDPNADAWWGDEPPFHVPVFVLTHHQREPVAKKGGTTFYFVTDGIESALERAQEAAGEKDVHLGGGAEVAQQYLRAGLLEEIMLHVSPLILGDGTRLFEGLGPDDAKLELAEVVESPNVTHIRYRVSG